MSERVIGILFGALFALLVVLGTALAWLLAGPASGVLVGLNGAAWLWLAWRRAEG